MKWFILLVGLLVICFVAALVLGLISGGMGRATSSLHHDPLPDTPLTDDDLDGLRFDVTARGYRMSQVDAVVARLQRELQEKNAQIAVLTGGAVAPTRGDATGEGTPEVADKHEAAYEPARELAESHSGREAVPEPVPEPVRGAVPEPVPEPVRGAVPEPVPEPPEAVPDPGLAPASASDPAPEDGAAVPAARDIHPGPRDA